MEYVNIFISSEPWGEVPKIKKKYQKLVSCCTRALATSLGVLDIVTFPLAILLNLKIA